MSTTQAVLFVVFVLLLTYTALAGRLGVTTISKTMRDTSWNWSIVPFITGLLCGHWFLNVKGGALYGWGWGIPIMVLLLAKDIYRLVKKLENRPIHQHPAWYLSLGILSGYLFWPLSF